MAAAFIGSGTVITATLAAANFGMSAIVVGNVAYQSGNISCAIAFGLLIKGSYKFIERTLIVIAAIMSLAFLITFIITRPDISALLSGLPIPSLPTSASLTVIGMIGTTVVPYNLFLHSSSASKKLQTSDQLPEAKKDPFISIP